MADIKDVEIEEKGLINAEKEKHAANNPGGFSMRFQLLATALIVVLAVVGGGVGIIMNNQETNPDIISWIGLPGDLFIRALKAVVLPLVFVNVILAVMQMIEAGKAGAVGAYTVGLYLATTFLASIQGMIIVAIFQNQFSSDIPPEPETFVNFLCPGGNDALTLVNGTGELACLPFEEGSDLQEFEIEDPNGVFVTTGDAFEAISFSQTLQDGIFRKLVPDNIVAEFANGAFVGVVMFGIIFGAASQSLKSKPVLLIDFLSDINDILVKIIQWIIFLTPIAVFSLIAAAIGGVEDLEQTFADIGILIGASVLAFATHIFIVYPALFFYVVRQNPYAYLRFAIPAQIFAFSCASSAATLPVTLRCVTETKQVPDSIRDFVLPIGATVNMDGTALYFPPAIVYLAVTSGFKDDLNAAAYFLIVLVSTIGSAGAAPVPNAGLVLIITAFNTVFNQGGTPANFAIIVGIDWLMDRFQTSINVTGDTMVARMVTKLSGLDIKEGQLTSEIAISQEVVEEVKDTSV